MVEGSFRDVFNVLVEGEVTVEDDTQVSAVGGGGQSGVVDSEVEVFGCLGERVWTDKNHVRFITV